MNIPAIYKIQSIVKPERCYIGSAVNIGKRWYEHLRDLKMNRHHCSKLQNHFNKYKEADLQFSILLGCDKNDLLKTEQYFLDSYNPYFNSLKIAGSALGRKQTEEAKLKMSNSKKGIRFTEEHKRKLSEAWKNRKPVTEETKKKLSLCHKGKPAKGHKQTEETKRKIGETLKRKITSGEIKPLCGHIPWNKGKNQSEETKKRVSEGLKRYFKAKKPVDCTLN